ncbi:MAG: DUF4272 domain-containing protein [Planctomycetota bacterium]
MDLNLIRSANLELLTEHGFRPAPLLPLGEPTTLRSQDEVFGRLWALDVAVRWVYAPVERFSDATLIHERDRVDAVAGLSSEEMSVFECPRSEASMEFGSEFGWKTEHLYTLAWVLGMSREPEFTGDFFGEEDQVAAYKAFVKPEYDATLANLKLRSLEEVVTLEDRFYCVHNVARSALFSGADTIPESFDAQANGGVVQERRHALTWCLSPGVAWDDTDLST